jgi:hypothetical protein
VILEHGEHVLVPGHDPEVERGRVEDRLLLSGAPEHAEGIFALSRVERVEGDCFDLGLLVASPRHEQALEPDERVEQGDAEHAEQHHRPEGKRRVDVAPGGDDHVA